MLPFFLRYVWYMRASVPELVPMQACSGQSQTAGVFLCDSLDFCPETGSVTEPEPCHLGHAGWHWLSGPACVHPPRLGLQVQTVCLQFWENSAGRTGKNCILAPYLVYLGNRVTLRALCKRGKCYQQSHTHGLKQGLEA